MTRFVSCSINRTLKIRVLSYRKGNLNLNIDDAVKTLGFEYDPKRHPVKTDSYERFHLTVESLNEKQSLCEKKVSL